MGGGDLVMLVVLVGGGDSAACRVLQSPAGVCSPLLYEANEKIPGYLYSSRA